jgi:hypothetical protein
MTDLIDLDPTTTPEVKILPEATQDECVAESNTRKPQRNGHYAVMAL